MNKKLIVLATLLSATSLVVSAAEAPKLSLHRNNIKTSCSNILLPHENSVFDW